LKRLKDGLKIFPHIITTVADMYPIAAFKRCLSVKLVFEIAKFLLENTYTKAKWD